MITTPMTDEEIDACLREPKHVSNPPSKMKVQRGSERIDYEAIGSSGRVYRIYVRKNTRMTWAFSCGISVVASSGEAITLARYNGSDHPHRNPLESSQQWGPVCHIHRATARYMLAGMKPEHYAEPTDRYSDLRGALKALLQDCKITGIGGEATSFQEILL